MSTDIVTEIDLEMIEQTCPAPNINQQPSTSSFSFKRTSDEISSVQMHKKQRQNTLNLGRNQNEKNVQLQGGIINNPLFIFREDKKTIPLNFVSKALKNWSHFNSITENSITRVGQGFSLRCMYPSSSPLPDPFELESVTYHCKRPSKEEEFQGESSIYLTDPVDFDLLKLSDTELGNLVEIPSSQGPINTVKEVKRTFPKRSSQVYTTENKPRLMKITISFTHQIPEYIAFDNLIIRVANYSPPPTRCYRCQHYGHGSLTCRRPQYCSKCGSKGHSNQDCSSETWKCASCQGNHGAGSNKCTFLRLATGVQTRLREGTISRKDAIEQYAKLYSSKAQPEPEDSNPSNISPSKQSIRDNNQSGGVRPRVGAATSESINVASTSNNRHQGNMFLNDPSQSLSDSDSSDEWQTPKTKRKKCKNKSSVPPPNKKMFDTFQAAASNWGPSNKNPSKSSKTTNPKVTEIPSKVTDREDSREAPNNQNKPINSIYEFLQKLFSMIMPILSNFLKSVTHPGLQLIGQFISTQYEQ